MKYRIVRKRETYYKVESRRRWWPFWTDRSRHYVSYSKPREVTRYGGLFNDIGYTVKESGRSSYSFWTQEEAEAHIKDLKRWDKPRRKKKETPKVVYTSES